MRNTNDGGTGKACRPLKDATENGRSARRVRYLPNAPWSQRSATPETNATPAIQIKRKAESISLSDEGRLLGTTINWL